MSRHEEATLTNQRILIVDDTKAIHEDFKKVLSSASNNNSELDDMEASLFGDAPDEEDSGMRQDATLTKANFELDSAFQGQEALEKVQQAMNDGRPYAMVFMDMRMPPGWDGVETLLRIWEVDPNLQAVICTAYSDYSWDEMTAKLGNPDRLLILKKPFENIEVLQAANALVSKWNWRARANLKMDELEQLVKERTDKVIEQKDMLQKQLEELKQTRLQLVQSEKLASIGQLAAGVAHEINNPVGFISSNLNTLRDYVADIKKVVDSYKTLIEQCATSEASLQQQAKTINQVEEEVGLDFVMEDVDTLLSDAIEGTQRVKKIVGDLSEFSHVNSPDIVEENLNELLEKTVSVAWNELKYKAEVVREFGDIPAISCYGGKLAQVFLNLLINAAHAIEDRGTITIRTNIRGERILVEIEDTGCGIEEENLAKIFDPFFTTKDVGKGTGLGLHVVQSVIENHRGEIRVESELGKGTCFFIELPIINSIQESAGEGDLSMAVGR